MQEAQPLTWKHIYDPDADKGATHPREQRVLPFAAYAALALLDHVAAAVLMLRQDGSIAWSNRSAAELTECESLDLRFRFLRDHPAVMRIRGRSGEPFVVTTHPLEVRSDDGARADVFIVVIVIPEARDIAPPPELLESLYGLTPAEARVAVEITRGKTITQIANEQHVATSTVRSQLKNVFGKMGVRRQPELVKRILSVATLPLAARIQSFWFLGCLILSSHGQLMP